MPNAVIVYLVVTKHVPADCVQNQWIVRIGVLFVDKVQIQTQLIIVLLISIGITLLKLVLIHLDGVGMQITIIYLFLDWINAQNVNLVLVQMDLIVKKDKYVPILLCVKIMMVVLLSQAPIWLTLVQMDFIGTTLNKVVKLLLDIAIIFLLINVSIANLVLHKVDVV